MLDDVTTLLTKPGAFFERRDDDPSVRGPLLTVAAVSVAGVVGTLAVMAVKFGKLSGDAAAIVAVPAVISVVVRAVMPIMVWLVYAGFFLAITALLDGEGDPRETILLAGWGMAPRVFGILVVSGLIFLANLLTPVPPGGTVQELNLAVGQHPAHLAKRVVQVAFFLWSGYIWVAAVEHARNVSRKRATVAVGVPLLVEILVSLGLVALELVGAAVV